MVLEKLFASLLNTVLAEFIEPGNLSQENLQIGVWSGYVVLEQLVLKKNLFDRSKTPLSLNYGVIGRLELRIPWKNIGYEPVILVLDEVLMLVQPKYEWDDVKVRHTREQAVKQAKLTAAAFFSSKKDSADSAGYTSYAEMMRGYLLDTVMRKMIDNFEVHVKSVHIRYEDCVSCPTDFCFGVTVESISMTTRSPDHITTDAKSAAKPASQLEAFIQSPGGEVFRKDIEVNNFAVYWNPIVPDSMDPCTSMFLNRADADIQRLMLRTLVYGCQELVDRPRHHFLFEPHDIFVESDVTFYKATVSTQANVTITVKDVSFTFEDRVFRELIALSANMSSFMQLEEFSMYRPKTAVFEDAKAWWRYAISAAIHQVQRRREKFSWMQMSQRRDDKFVYIELWKCKLFGLKSGTRPAVKIAKKEKCSKLEQLYDPALPAGSHDSPADNSDCYSEILALSHVRRGPIEALYHPGEFKVPRGRDVSAVQAALGQGTQTEMSSVRYYPLTPELLAMLRQLEERLSFEDISFFRTLAERDLAMEGRTPQTWLGGVSSWIFGSWQATSPADMISEEDRKKLYESLHFDPEAVFAASGGGGGAADASGRDANQPSRMIASVSYNIEKMGVSLALSAPASKYCSYSSSHMTPFLEIELKSIHVDVTVMGTAMPGGSHTVTNMSVGDFEAFEVIHNDAISEGSFRYSEKPSSRLVDKQYVKLVSRKGKELRRRKLRSYSTASSRTPGKHMGDEIELDKSMSEAEDDMLVPLINVCVESDTSMKDLVDLAVNITVEELELFISPTQKLPQFLETFFTWPADLEFWSEMEMAAINEIADFQYVLSCKIDYMRRNHMNIEIMASIKAPVLIVTETVPLQSKLNEDCNDDVNGSSPVAETGYLIVDLGHISVHTEKLAKAAYEMSLVDHTMRDMSVSGTEADAPSVFSERIYRSAALDKHNRLAASAMSPRDSIGVRAGELVGKTKVLSTPLSTRRLLHDYDDDSTSAPPTVNLRYDAMMMGSHTNSSSGDPGEESKVPRPLQSILSDAIGNSPEQLDDDADREAEGNEDSQEAAEAVNTSTNDPVARQDSLYDIFKVSISDCSVYMISSLTELAEPMSTEQFKQRCIVDRYDINMNIHVSVLQWDKELPPIKLEVGLPSMHLLLSEEKILRMAAIINSVTENSKRIVEAQKGVLSKFELAKERMRMSTSSNELVASQGYFVRDGSKMIHRHSQVDLLPGAADIENKGTTSTEEARAASFGHTLAETALHSPLWHDRTCSDFDEELGLQFFDASPGMRSRSTTADERDRASGDGSAADIGQKVMGVNFLESEEKKSTSLSFSRSQSQTSASRLSRLSAGPSTRTIPAGGDFEFPSAGLLVNGSGEAGRSGPSGNGESIRSSQYYSAALMDVGGRGDTLPQLLESSYGGYIDTVDVRSEYDGTIDAMSDAGSDDSFQSVMEHEMTADEAKDLAESIQVMLQQREVMAAHAMEDMRLAETDIGKQATSKHRTLQKELRQLEAEVQHLRVSYVEALIRADEMKRREKDSMSPINLTNGDTSTSVSSVPTTVGAASTTSNFPAQPSRRRTLSVGNLPHQEVIDSLSKPSDQLRTNLVSKRTLLQNSVFRPLPDSHRRRYVGVRGGVGGNKELVRLSLELSTVTVDFLCSKPVIATDESTELKGGTPLRPRHKPTPSSGNSRRSNNLTPNAFTPSEYSPSVYSPYDISPLNGSRSPSAPERGIDRVPDTSLLRLQISGIKTSVKHKADDSKILFSVQSMSVEDIFQTMRVRNAKLASATEKGFADAASDRALLLTTDAPFYSTGAPHLPRPRGFSMDADQLVKLDTKIVYGKETTIDATPRTDGASRSFSFYQSPGGKGDQKTVMYPTTAKVNVTLGYLGVNFDQEVLAHLYRTVLSISSHFSELWSQDLSAQAPLTHGANTPPLKAESGGDMLSEQNTPIPKRVASARNSTGGSRSSEDSPRSPMESSSDTAYFGSLVTLKLSTKAVGFSVSVIHKHRPILTSAVLGLSTTVRRYGDESLELKTRVVDINAHYLRYKAPTSAGSLRHSLVSNQPDVDIFYKEPIFGRPADSLAPALEISVSGSTSARENRSVDAKTRVSCLIECTPIEIVVVPKAIVKLVDSIYSGPMMSMIRTAAAPELSNENTPPRTGTIFSAINPFMVELFEKVEGNMNLMCNSLSIYVLSNYVPQVPPVIGSGEPGGNQLVVLIKKISFDCAFGGECEFGGVEICQSILGIGLSVDHQQVIEPFDVSIHLAMLHDIGLSNYYYIPDRTHSLFQSPWKPIVIDSISGGQLLGSTAVSPISVNIHEGIIISLHNFFDRNKDYFRRLFDAPNSCEQAPRPPSTNSAAVIPIWRQELGCSVGVATLVYEVSVSLQAVSVVPTSAGVPKQSSSKNKSRRKQSRRTPANAGLGYHDVSSNWWKDAPAEMGTAAVPIMEVVLRELRSDVVLNSVERSESAQNDCDTPLNAPILLLKTKVRSFDICHLKAPKDAICRVVATVARRDIEFAGVLSPTVSIHPASGFSHYFCEDIIFHLEPPDRFLFFCDGRISRGGDVSLTSQVSNLQFVVLTDTLFTFSSLALLYITALSDSSTMASVRRMATHLPTQTMVGLSRKESFEDLVASEMEDTALAETVLPETVLSTTHPVSQPLLINTESLRVSEGSTSAAIISADKDAEEVSGPVLLDRRSFELPGGITSLRLGFTSVGCGGYLPGSDRSPQVPGVYFGARCDCVIRYVPIEWEDAVREANEYGERVNSDSSGYTLDGGDLSRDMMGPEACYSCWDTSASLSDVRISLEALSYPELFTTATSQSRFELGPSSPSYDEFSNCFSTDPLSNKSAPTSSDSISREKKIMLVKPFSMQVHHQILMYPNHEAPGIVVHRLGDQSEQSSTCIVPLLTQKIDISITGVDAYAFVDYRPLLRVYKNCIQPLSDIPNLMAGMSELNVMSSTDQPLVPTLNGDVLNPQRVQTHVSSPTRNARSRENGSQVVNGIPSKRNYLSSVLEVLSSMSDISNCTVKLVMTGLSVTLVNDAYREPVCIFKVHQDSSVVTVMIDRQSVSSALLNSPIDNKISFAVPPLSTHRAMVPSSHIISVSCVVKVRVDYQNYTLGAWEPLVEPFEVIVTSKIPINRHVQKHIHCRPDDLSNASTTVPRLDAVWAVDTAAGPNLSPPVDYEAVYTSCFAAHMVSSAGTAPTNAPIKCKVSIPSVVNFNVTSGLLDTLQGTIDEVQNVNSEIAYDAFRVLKARKTSDGHPQGGRGLRFDTDDEMALPEDLSLLTVRNDTGMVLRLWAREVESHDEESFDIAVNSSQPLDIRGHSDSLIAATEEHEQANGVNAVRHVSMCVLQENDLNCDPMEYPRITDLPLEGDGCRLFLLESGVDAESGINYKNQESRQHRGIVASPLPHEFLQPNAVCIVSELISSRGVRTLLVRSTLYFFNALSLPVEATLIAPAHTLGVARRLWSSTVPPNTGVSLPAQFCNVPNAGVEVRPLRPMTRRNTAGSSVIVDIPGFPGQNGESKRGESIINAPLAAANLETGAHIGESELNRLRHRLKLQKRTTTAPDTQSYSNWICFPSDAVDIKDEVNSASGVGRNKALENAVVNVVSSGAPSKYQSKYADSFLSRTITLLPTVIVSNCLAYSLEVAVVHNDGGSQLSSGSSSKSLDYLIRSSGGDGSLDAMGKCFTTYLASGDSISTIDFHPTEDLVLCFKIQNSSSSNSSWSTPVKLSRCGDDSTVGEAISEAEIVFENGSSLFVNVEVLDKGGVREISIYVPYWLITSSEFPLVFQHDTAEKAVTEKRLNGSDDLCADQFFYDKEHVKAMNRGDDVNSGRVGGNHQKKSGFKLGPEADSGGLLDVLSAKSHTRVKPLTRRPLKSNQAIWSSTQALDPNLEMNSILDLESSYKLLQFSHSRESAEADGSHSGRVRLSVNGTSWSRAVKLDHLGSTNVEVLSDKSRFRSWLSSVRRRAAARMRAQEEQNDIYDAKDTVSYGVLEEDPKVQHRAHSFGVTAMRAEYPFQRTKLVMIVDQYVLLNNTGQPLQVMQCNSNTVTPVAAMDSLALSWHSHGERYIQLRLNQGGWKWSGGFDPTKEGDTSLRLRNEHDSTVYFILVHVVKKGPRMFIALKGGEKMATYRIENHTIRKIRLQQLDVDDVNTTLLQYHTCMYSWDEPLKEQKFKLEIDVSDNGTRWVSMGVYSFERLVTYPRVGEFNIRVVARGPLRVLQIYPASNKESEFEVPVTDSDGTRGTSYERDLFNKMAPSGSSLVLELQVADVGLSIIDRSPEELLYISVSDIAVRHELSCGSDLFDFNIGAVHVDNQLLSTPFPSMFSPVASLTAEALKPRVYRLIPAADSDSALADSAGDEIKGDIDSANSVQNRRYQSPFVSMTMRRDFSYPGIYFFPLIKVNVLPFDINIESAILGKLITAVSVVLKANVDKGRRQREHPVLARTGMTSVSRERMAALYPSSIISNRQMKNVQMRDKSKYRFDATPFSMSQPAEPTSQVQRQPRHYSLHRIPFGESSNWRPEFLLSFVTQKALHELSPPADEVMKSTTKIYIDRLEMSAVSMNISFNPGIFQGTNLDDDTLGMNILIALLRGVGSTMAIDNVPLKFRSIEFDHLYGSASSVTKTISAKYTVQAVVQGLLAMLSLEALGNPVHLIKTVWEGVYDFVSYPLQGMIKSPVEFVNGLMKGTESLVFRLISTLANTVNRIANNSRNVMLVLRLVSNAERYYAYSAEDAVAHISGPLKSRAEVKILDEQSRSAHLVLGAAANTTPTYLPSNALKGLFRGVTGLVRFPYNGFMRGGIQGLCFGLVRGAFELITKPLFGALTGVSFAMFKCQNWFSYRINLGHRRRLQRIRPPRIIEPFGNPLNLYAVEEHVGTELLTRICNGEYRNDRYKCHFVVRPPDLGTDTEADDMICILTSKRIIVVGGKTTDYCELKWVCPLANVARITRDRGGADVLEIFYSTTVLYPEKADANSIASHPKTRLRFCNALDSTKFLGFLLEIRPDLRTIHNSDYS